MTRYAAIPLFALLALAPTESLATQQGINVMKGWQAADKCAAQAAKAFPDYTPEALAKRDASLKACLASQNLAPRDPQAPSR